MRHALLFIFAFTFGACSYQPSDSPESMPSPSAGAARPSEDEAWLLTGTSDERFARIARQLRGFDVAMVETGYRYVELYWAGQNRNWDYAKYQVEKIRTAVKNGVERRPKRGPSAQVLEGALPGLEEAITAKDPTLFAERSMSSPPRATRATRPSACPSSTSGRHRRRCHPPARSHPMEVPHELHEPFARMIGNSVWAAGPMLSGVRIARR
jgi:hypothetical protein